MNADAQLMWIASAVDAMEDIRAAEVAGISAEVRRTITRPAQIVPEIAKLVAEKRQRRAPCEKTPQSREFAISRESQHRRNVAKGRDEIEAAWEWERNARLDAGLHVPSLAPALTCAELDNMPAHIAKLGMAYGLLERRDGKLVEA